MQTGDSSQTQQLTEMKTRYTPRCKVVGLDDDVTIMEYVAWLFMDVFHKPEHDALQLMLEVHKQGRGFFYAGTREACELKLEETQARNKDHNQNLRVILEKEPV